MKKRKIVLAAIFLVLLTLGLWGLVRFFPLWRTGKIIWENMNSEQYAYELKVELDQEKLTEGQEKVLRHLTWLTGIDREAMYRLTIRGSVQEKKIHAMIYPEGAEDPLTEFYLDGDNCVISESAIYNAIRNHLVEQYRILRLLMPEQKEALYISMEQVEQLFDLDMEGLRSFDVSKEEKDISVWQYFLMLTAMSEKKEDKSHVFELLTEKVSLHWTLEEAEGVVSVKMLLEIEDVAETMAENEELFSRFGFPVPAGQSEMVKNLTVVIMPGKGSDIAMPENLVNQEIIDGIVKVRDWIRENLLDEKGTPVVSNEKERAA